MPTLSTGHARPWPDEPRRASGCGAARRPHPRLVTLVGVLTLPTLAGTSPRTIVRSIGGGGIQYVATTLLGLVSVPILLHRLGVAAYGVWVAVTALFALGTLADVGVRTEVVRRVAARWGEGDRPAAARAGREGSTILLVAGVVVGGLGALLAPAVVHIVFPRSVRGVSEGQIIVLVRTIAVLVGVSLVGDGFFSVLRGVQRTDLEALCRTVGEAVGSVVAIVWVLGGGGLWAMAMALAVQIAVDYGGRWLAVRRVLPEVRPVPALPDAVRPWLLSGGLLVLSQVSDVVDTQWDKLVLAHYVGSVASAAYAIGTTMAGQAKVLAVVVLAPIVAAAAELHRSRPRELRAVYDRLGSASLAVAGVGLGFVLVLGPPLVHLWLGGAHLVLAGQAAQLSAVALWLNLTAAPLAMLLIGSGRPMLPAASAGANIAVNAVVSLTLTRAIGFDGALFGSIIGNATGLAVLIGCAWRVGLLQLPPLRGGLAAALVAVVAWSLIGGRGAGWAGLVARGSAYLVAQGLAVMVVSRVGSGRRRAAEISGGPAVPAPGAPGRAAL